MFRFILLGINLQHTNCRKIFEEIDDYPYAMLKLAMMMGHSHYNTTLDSYIHYDFIRLLQNKYLI